MIGGRWIGAIRLPASSELTYALAVSLIATVFGLVLPVVAFLSGSIQSSFSVEYPRVPAFLIEISPWGPLLFMALGIAALVAKQSWCRQPSR